MLQYYTMMRTKNKMKDSKAKFEEWWEVVEEYFTKELEKNLAQHKVDERILRYKFETYKKKRFYLWQSNKYKGIQSGRRD